MKNFYFLICLLVFSCNIMPKENLTKEPINIRVAGCNSNNFAAMFDSLKSSIFVAEDFMHVELFLDETFVNKIVIKPAIRRGYSKDYKIIAFVNKQKYFFDFNNQEIVFEDSIKIKNINLVFVENKIQKCNEFQTDSTRYFVNLVEKQNPIGIESLQIFSGQNNILENAIVHQAIFKTENQNSFGNELKKNFVSKSFGNLFGKHIIYIQDNQKIHFLIKEDGMTNFWFENQNKLYFGNNINISIKDNYLNVFDTKIKFDGLNSEMFNLKHYPELFFFDIRYSTKNNFTNEVLYPWDFCYLRYDVARDLMLCAEDFLKQNYKIKMFDGYRPLEVQKFMWSICPDINFLAPPSKGSNHNRGCAVDLTICEQDANNLDMGTDFDTNSLLSWPTCTEVSNTAYQNRQLLKQTLRKYGFGPSKTEWWHFNHYQKQVYQVSNFVPQK